MEWYYGQNDQQHGPVSDTQLMALFEAGEIGADNLVWRNGMPDWQPLGTVFELPDEAHEPEPAAAQRPAATATSATSSRTGGKRKLIKKRPGSATRTSAAVATTTAANPYAAPSASLDTSSGFSYDNVLASVSERFLARLVDCVVMLLVFLPLFLVVFSGENQTLAATGGILFFVALIAMIVIQIVYLVKHAATIGKKMMGIYIADMAGNNASVGKILLLRMFANGILANVIPFYGIIDICLIFRQDRRCCHDLIAGTQVLKRGTV